MALPYRSDHACLLGRQNGILHWPAVDAQRNAGQRKWYAVCWVGLATAATLHGLSDWGTLNGHWAWVVIDVVSALLFLTYAKADPPVLPAAGADGRMTPAVQTPVTVGTSPARPPHDIEAEIEALKREMNGEHVTDRLAIMLLRPSAVASE